MENKVKIYTKEKFATTPVKCLEDGTMFDSVKHMCGVIYGVEFKQFNNIGNLIEKGKVIRGSHYIFYENN